MFLIQFCFYLFASLLTIFAIAAIYSRNPVHSVIFLIKCFVMTAPLMILIGAEFIAFLLIIIYVGAIAILFLFVVMMLPRHKNEDIQSGFVFRRFMAMFFSVLLVSSMCYFTYDLKKDYSSPVKIIQIGTSKEINRSISARDIGKMLFDQNLISFSMIGLILLIAVIGPISLTLHKRSDIKRQSMSNQISRRRDLKMIDLKSGLGAEGL